MIKALRARLANRNSRQYDAFISYKHGASADFIIDLEAALKTYAKPLLALPRRVFRDEKHLTPGVDLPQLILDALADSRFMILVASPDAASSSWVHDEIEYWCGTLQRKANLIVILVSGGIAVDPQTKVIDWGQTDALPPVLQKYLSKVPLYVDFSASAYQGGLGLRHPLFKTAINGIVARLRGVDPNNMLGIEMLQHQRNLRLRNGAVSAIVGLSLATSLAAYLAMKQRDEAISRSLAAMALQPESRIDVALLTAVAAFRSAPSAEALNSLRSVSYSISDVDLVLGGAEPLLVGATDVNGQYFAAGGLRRALVVWRLSDGAVLLETTLLGTGRAAGLTFLPGSDVLTAISSDGQLCTTRTATPALKCWASGLGSVTSMTARDSRSVIVLHDLNKFSIIDATTHVQRTVVLPGELPHAITILEWDLVSGTDTVVVSTYDGAVQALNLVDGSVTSILTPGSPRIHAVRYDARSADVALADEEKHVKLWNARTGAMRDAGCDTATPLHRIAFLPNSMLGADIDGALYFCGMAVPGVREHRPGYNKGHVSELLPVAGKQNRFLVLSEDGLATLRLASKGSPAIETLPGGSARYSRLAFSTDGELLLAGTDDGAVLSWRIANPHEPERIGRQQTMIRGLAMDRSGTRLAFGGQDASVQIAQPGGGTTVSIPVPGAPFDYASSVAYSPSDDVLVVATSGGKVSLYEALNGPQIGKTETSPHKNTLCCASFDRSGTFLFSADNDGFIVARDAATGAATGELMSVHAGIIGGLSSTNIPGEVLSVGMDGRVVITRMADTAPRCTVRHPDSSITLAAAHAVDAPLFASISRASVAVWSSQSSCRLIFQAIVPPANAATIAVSPTGSTVAWSTWGSPISVLKIAGGETLVKEACKRVSLSKAAEHALPSGVRTCH